MDFVGIVERAVVHVEVFSRPGIALGHRHLAVVIAPIALAPVAGVIADTGVADGSGEEVGFGLQVLRHKAAVAGSEASDALAVDEGMLLGKAARALNDVVGHEIAGGIYVARGIFLSESGGTTGVDDEDDVALRGEELRRVATLEAARRGRAASIIIYEQRIFLRGVERGRQAIASADGVAARADEVPRLALAHGQIGVESGVLVIDERGFERFQVGEVAARGVHRAQSRPRHQRLRVGE